MQSDTLGMQSWGLGPAAEAFRVLAALAFRVVRLMVQVLEFRVWGRGFGFTVFVLRFRVQR